MTSSLNSGSNSSYNQLNSTTDNQIDGYPFIWSYSKITDISFD